MNKSSETYRSFRISSRCSRAIRQEIRHAICRSQSFRTRTAAADLAPLYSGRQHPSTQAIKFEISSCTQARSRSRKGPDVISSQNHRIRRQDSLADPPRDSNRCCTLATETVYHGWTSCTSSFDTRATQYDPVEGEGGQQQRFVDFRGEYDEMFGGAEAPRPRAAASAAPETSIPRRRQRSRSGRRPPIEDRGISDLMPPPPPCEESRAGTRRNSW